MLLIYFLFKALRIKSERGKKRKREKEFTYDGLIFRFALFLVKGRCTVPMTFPDY